MCRQTDEHFLVLLPEEREQRNIRCTFMGLFFIYVFGFVCFVRIDSSKILRFTSCRRLLSARHCRLYEDSE